MTESLFDQDAERYEKAWLEAQRQVDIGSWQSWFWTPEWQAAEAEADADLAAGRYKDFDTMDELIADLTRARPHEYLWLLLGGLVVCGIMWCVGQIAREEQDD